MPKRVTRVKPDEGTAPEVTTAEKEPEVITAGKEPEVITAEKEANLIKVRPVRGYMWEPFQCIPIQENVETPVEETDWVTSQIDAGLLEKC